MADYASEISALIGNAPNDLVAFYRNAVNHPNYPEGRINCLPFQEAKEHTGDMKGISVVDRLGLWVLTDANDSNPYCYITRGPCCGLIIHFSHDPEPEIAFSSLKSFCAALNEAGVRGQDIDEVKKESIGLSLDTAMVELSEEDSEDAVFLLTTYLPVCSSLEAGTKSVLVGHADFFVREAFAVFLARIASGQDTALADRLAGDQHPQVARAGKSAVAAIRDRKGHA